MTDLLALFQLVKGHFKARELLAEGVQLSLQALLHASRLRTACLFLLAYQLCLVSTLVRFLQLLLQAADMTADKGFCDTTFCAKLCMLM